MQNEKKNNPAHQSNPQQQKDSVLEKDHLEQIKKALNEGLKNFNIVETVNKIADTLAKKNLTTSQVRQFYGQIKRIQMVGLENEIASLMLLVPKLYYNMKRSDNSDGLKGLKEFVETMVKEIDKENQISQKEKFERMVQLTEAFVAFHKVHAKK